MYSSAKFLCQRGGHTALLTATALVEACSGYLERNAVQCPPITWDAVGCESMSKGGCNGRRGAVRRTVRPSRACCWAPPLQRWLDNTVLVRRKLPNFLELRSDLRATQFLVKVWHFDSLNASRCEVLCCGPACAHYAATCRTPADRCE